MNEITRSFISMEKLITQDLKTLWTNISVSFTRSQVKEIEILVHNVFKSCAINFSIEMKLLVILFVIKIFAWINIFKHSLIWNNYCSLIGWEEYIINHIVLYDLNVQASGGVWTGNFPIHSPEALDRRCSVKNMF